MPYELLGRLTYLAARPFLRLEVRGHPPPTVRAGFRLGLLTCWLFGRAVSSLPLSEKLQYFVIDTARNGLGPSPDDQWCNPPGRVLGEKPSGTTVDSLVDAYLWSSRLASLMGRATAVRPPASGGPVTPSVLYRGLRTNRRRSSLLRNPRDPSAQAEGVVP